jgi:hypothetical protein
MASPCPEGSLEVQTLIALHAAEHRKRHPDPDRIAELKHAIAEARTETFLREMMAKRPPLSEAARSRLAALLKEPPLAASGAKKGGGDATA